MSEWRIAPVLIVRNITSSVGYYRDRLAFDVMGIFGNPPEMAFVGRQRIQLILQDAEGRPTPGPNHRYKSVAWDALVWVSDVRSLHDDFARRGAQIRKAPYVTFYGQTEIEIEHLDNHVICFSQPPSPASKD